MTLKEMNDLRLAVGKAVTNVIHQRLALRGATVADQQAALEVIQEEFNRAEMIHLDTWRPPRDEVVRILTEALSFYALPKWDRVDFTTDDGKRAHWYRPRPSVWADRGQRARDALATLETIKENRAASESHPAKWDGEVVGEMMDGTPIYRGMPE